MKKYRYHLIVLLAGISWSTLAIFSKYASNLNIDPFNQVFWRIIIGLITSILIYTFLFKNKHPLNSKAYLYLLVNGLFFMLGFTTFSASIYLGSPIAKAIALNYSYPLAVVALSYLLFKHKPSAKNILAVLLSLVSVALLMEIWTVKNLTQISSGDFLAWLNSFAFAAIIVWGTKMRQDLKINSFLILAWSWLFSLPMLFFVSTFLQSQQIPLFSPVLKTDFSFLGWLSLVGLGTISSVLPISLMYYGSSKLKPFVTSILLLSEPVMVYLAGIFLFNQTLSIWGILGMIGIMISVLLT